jgi:hypothetical protein
MMAAGSCHPETEAVEIRVGHDGEMFCQDLDQVALRLLKRCAIRNNRGMVVRLWDLKDKTLVVKFQVMFGPGFTLMFPPAAAATTYGANLILALERVGAGNRIRIGAAA